MTKRSKNVKDGRTGNRARWRGGIAAPKGFKPAAKSGRVETQRALVQAAQRAADVVLYQAPEGNFELEVRIERDTVWLSQAQMVDLFGRDQSVVSRHVRNVFAEGELPEESNMQKMHIAQSDKPITLYSLDTIISVGYRVKSHQGTQFRIWATQTIRDHLLRGYTLNEKRLREKGLAEIEQAVELLSSTLKNQALVTDQGRAVLDVIQKYTRAWRLLLGYDEDRLSSSPANPHDSPHHLHDAHSIEGADQVEGLCGMARHADTTHSRRVCRCRRRSVTAVGCCAGMPYKTSTFLR